MTTVKVFAPAKINLTLHVTGRRDDGYHLLDSLVAFVDTGDQVAVTPADALSLRLSGPFAHQVPTGDDNLVLRAARLLGGGPGAEIELIKQLPVSAGVGGGSADAAATIRALCALWDKPWPDAHELALLGADIPVCMASGLTRMQGVGEELTPLGSTPAFHVVLINPGVAVPTQDVFRALSSKTNAPMHAFRARPGDPGSYEDWLTWLATQRNDLEAPAIADFPVIGNVLDALRGLDGCRLARMSGSGATCFGLFQTVPNVRRLVEEHPDWWVEKARGWPVPFGDDDAASGAN